MKKLLFLAVIALLSCSTEQPEQAVIFTSGIQSGSLKSFDIKEWKHFHYPFTVIVTLKSQATGIEYHATAANATTFFNGGTETIHLPYGLYNCSVHGGGYPNDELTHSYSYYVWNIKDTVINVTSETDIIRFDLDKTAALVVKDMTSDIQLIADRNASLTWTGRGAYDFAYVTPGTYSGLYTDSLGYQNSTEWFEIKADNYYYFLSPNVKSTVVVPEFTKNEIWF